MASYVEVAQAIAKLDWGMSFQRTGKFPIDRSSMFDSYADAVKYAAGNTADPDKRGLCGSSYIGQVITVFENDVVNVYKIEADRSLSEVGTVTAGDNKSITLSEDGILSLVGFENAVAGQQLRVVNKGTAEEPDLQIEWFTPDTSTVDGLQAAVGALNETVDGVTDENGEVTKEGLVHKVAALEQNKADKTSVYTKDEIDGKLTGALHYKGTQESFTALTEAVAGGTITPVTGDVWNITAAGGTDASGVAIQAGDNVIYNGTGWDVSSGTIDLSGYYTKTEADALLEGKVDVVEGQRLMTDAEGQRLSELTKVEASDVNGNIKIDGAETNVYTLPTADASTIGGVKSSTEKDKVAVEADGTMSLNGVSAAKIDGVVAEAAKVSNTIKIGSKTFDGSAAVEITATDIPLPADVVHKSDIATTEVVGVVKASADENGVSVGTDGKMTVNNISSSKINGVVAEAAKVTNKLKAGSKTFDGSANVEITAEDLGAMKTADMTPYVKFENIATSNTAGVVKSSTAQDKVDVGADGVMTVNDISADKVKGTVSKAADAEKLGGVASADILDGTAGKVKSAAAADKLANARDITLTGDATGTTSFDGTQNVEVAVTLKDTGTAGTYVKVTTDAKGRVVSGVDKLVYADIPELDLEKITDAGAMAAKDTVARTDLDTNLLKNITDLEDASHGHANKGVIDGITATQVAGWDHAAEKIDSKADAATTLSGYGITDAYTKSEIDGKLTGALHYKGTYDTFAELEADVTDGTITPATGDVYNVKTAGGVDAHGVAIKAGDNVIFNGTGWDASSGTTDLSAYSTTEQMNAKLAEKAEKTLVDTINEDVAKLKTAVGDENGGLAKTVAEHTTKIGTMEGNIATLQDTVGDDTKGLVKGVADNKAAIETLNGDENTEGSVKKIVAASAATLNEAITNITKDGGTIDTKVEDAVTAHNTATDAHADLFAAKQNKVIHTTVTFEVADFVENSDNEAAYKATKTISGLDTAKSYAPNITPDVASCKVITAAGFYPTAVVDAGTLTLYCRTAPTAAIVVSGTFTEIQ